MCNPLKNIIYKNGLSEAMQYRRLSLSRLRLSRIIAYIEVKIWTLLKHKYLTTGTKIPWKRGEIRSNFSSFPQYFQDIFNFRSKITYSFVKCCCPIYFYLNSANLIRRVTDIAKYFSESLGLRDNESRLYILDTRFLFPFFFFFYFFLIFVRFYGLFQKSFSFVGPELIQ